jgi:hypothetical protein
MAESYTKNAAGYKNSCQKYRNIAGIRYIEWDWQTEKFPEYIEYAKIHNLKYKIIAGEFFIQDHKINQ